jgi:hypothetical protein
VVTAARVAAGLAAAAIVAGLAVAALAPAHVSAAIADGGPACPFRYATGIDCPFCGMTHATLALGAGDWRGALAYHPLAPIVLFGTLALFVVVAAGRADSLLANRRPLWLLAAIAAIWVLRLVL